MPEKNINTYKIYNLLEKNFKSAAIYFCMSYEKNEIDFADVL